VQPWLWRGLVGRHALFGQDSEGGLDDAWVKARAGGVLKLGERLGMG
jgi:hypothetical protein